MNFPMQGHFWLPGSPNKSVYGTLTFTRREGANLALGDALSADKSELEHAIIVGQTAGTSALIRSGFSRNFRARLIALNAPKHGRCEMFYCLRANGFSPEPCAVPSPRPILPPAELCRATARRSGSHYGSHFQFRRVLPGLPPRFPFCTQPLFARLV